MKAVRFDRYGGIEELHIADIGIPDPGPEEVLVQVRAAGINPGEAGIRQGMLRERFPASFPSGEGSDFAGVVKSRGSEVKGFAPGDEVLGWSWTRSSHAEYVAVPATQVVPKPAGLSWEIAGALYVAGVTAYAAVEAVAPQPGETVVVSAAAGGVGSLVVQLLRLKEARVVGIASESNHEWLASKGVVPVAYGPNLEDEIRHAAPDGVAAFIDLFGPQYIDLALDLGVAPVRINTIIAFERAAEVGALTKGSAEGSSPEVLAHLADLAATGKLEVPIAATFPLADVRSAFELLEQRHTHGKVVLIP